MSEASKRLNWRSLRLRTTAGAALVVGLVLLVAGAAMVMLLRRSLTADVRNTAAFRAKTVAGLLDSGTGPEDLPLGGDDDQFIQVVRDGSVVAASGTVEGEPLVVELGVGQERRVEVPFEDDGFLVLSRASQDGEYQVLVGRTLEQVDESTSVVIGLLVFGLPILLLAVLFVTWRVVGRALGPVESIRTQVEWISGDRLDARVPAPETGDEIARLAHTMNRMLERLEASSERQRRFVSDASHELRSPVASIRQHVEVALRHPETTSTEDLARVVLDEDLRIQQLVDDLLLLARMDEGARPDKASVDLDDIVFEEVRRPHGEAAVGVDARGVSAGRVLGDRKQLTQLVSNLMRNAIGHARTKVRLSLEESDGRVALVVEDDGEGIPRTEQDRVFERFVRLEDSRARDSGGAGLGLAIVAEVARAHGGRATAGSSDLGGARIDVILPSA
jgi:signal transduction histidine kinase